MFSFIKFLLKVIVEFVWIHWLKILQVCNLNAGNYKNRKKLFQQISFPRKKLGADHIQYCSCDLYARDLGCCRNDWHARRTRRHWYWHLLSPGHLVGGPAWSDATVHQSVTAPYEALPPPRWKKGHFTCKPSKIRDIGQARALNPANLSNLHVCSSYTHWHHILCAT